MTKEQIIKAYRVFAIINLCSSLVYLALLSGIELNDKIFAAVVFNIGYHLFYFFLSRAPIAQLNWLKRNNSVVAESLAPSAFKLFSLLAIAGSLFISIQLIMGALNKNEYLELFAIFIPVGLFLGAYSLKLSLDKK